MNYEVVYRVVIVKFEPYSKSESLFVDETIHNPLFTSNFQILFTFYDKTE